MKWQQQVYRPKTRSPRVPKAVREEALRRAGGKCERCDGTNRLAMHHIMPRSEGGGDNVENLAVLCRRCHNLVERVGILRTRGMIRAGPAISPPRKPFAEGEDWRMWVYGGARNPLHDK